MFLYDSDLLFFLTLFNIIFSFSFVILSYIIHFSYLYEFLEHEFIH